MHSTNAAVYAAPVDSEQEKGLKAVSEAVDEIFPGLSQECFELFNGWIFIFAIRRMLHASPNIIHLRTILAAYRCGVLTLLTKLAWVW